MNRWEHEQYSINCGNYKVKWEKYLFLCGLFRCGAGPAEKIQGAVVGLPALRPVPVADLKDMGEALALGAGPEQSLMLQGLLLSLMS